MTRYLDLNNPGALQIPFNAPFFFIPCAPRYLLIRVLRLFLVSLLRCVFRFCFFFLRYHPLPSSRKGVLYYVYQLLREPRCAQAAFRMRFLVLSSFFFFFQRLFNGASMASLQFLTTWMCAVRGGRLV